MKIGELSKKSGLSKETIRYYQKLGLFEGCVEQGENNYREFTNEAIEILDLIKTSKFYGFTLKENLALLKVRHCTKEKLRMMEEFTKAKISKNQQEISRLQIQNQRLEDFRYEIAKCKEQCT